MHSCDIIYLIKDFALLFSAFHFIFVQDHFFAGVYFLSLSFEGKCSDFQEEIVSFSAKYLNETCKFFYIVRCVTEIFQREIVCIKDPFFFHAIFFQRDNMDFNFFCADTVSPKETAICKVQRIAARQFFESIFCNEIFSHFFDAFIMFWIIARRRILNAR